MHDAAFIPATMTRSAYIVIHIPMWWPITRGAPNANESLNFKLEILLDGGDGGESRRP